MAGYGFAPAQVGGFGGGYLSLGIGQSLGNAANAGLRLANGFREYQNANMTDQFTVGATSAQADAQRIQGANDAFQGQVQNEIMHDRYARSATAGVPTSDGDVGTHYAAQPGAIGQNGMAAVGGDMAIGNPYAQPQYGSDAFQTALMNSNGQRNALNYDPMQSPVNIMSQNGLNYYPSQSPQAMPQNAMSYNPSQQYLQY